MRLQVAATLGFLACARLFSVGQMDTGFLSGCVCGRMEDFSGSSHRLQRPWDLGVSQGSVASCSEYHREAQLSIWGVHVCSIFSLTILVSIASRGILETSEVPP